MYFRFNMIDRSLRDNQYRYNKMVSDKMQVDYSGKVPMYSWVVNKSDLDEYRDTTPPKRNPDTMVFRRYDNLLHGLDTLVPTDVLVQALLGFPHPLGINPIGNSCILNDDWVVNLQTRQEDNIYMSAFLRGFQGMEEELKKLWGMEGHKMKGVDVSEELKDLLRVYQDAENHLKEKEQSALDYLSSYMKRYLDAKEERKKVTQKLKDLKSKLQGGDDDEDEDEGDDE